jgi:hypothetical protein
MIGRHSRHANGSTRNHDVPLPRRAFLANDDCAFLDLHQYSFVYEAEWFFSIVWTPMQR